MVHFKALLFYERDTIVIEKIYAGIVTYNPDINKLKRNIESVLVQVESVVVVDNSSQNVNDIIELCNSFNINIICNDSNKGIASALNQIMQFAYEENAHWCITLDQDSVCPNELVSCAKNVMGEDNIGQIIPQIKDANTGDVPSLDSKVDSQLYQKVKKSITSASITNVAIWHHIGGFDDALFIDYVDFDYSIRLRISGYCIVRMNNVFLTHELGESVYRRLFFKKVRVANHTAFRKYYICRNIVIYIKRYHKYINVLVEILRIFKTILFVVIYEKDKQKKLSSCFKGIKDGLTFKEN